MPKKSSTLPLNLPEPKPGVPLYRWLYEELRAAILGGHLPPGMRLPASRELAGQYGLSRPTIITAFDQLRAEGYVEGKVGSGTYVSQTLPDELLQSFHPSDSQQAVGTHNRPTRNASRLRQIRNNFADRTPQPAEARRNERHTLPLRGARPRPARAFRGGEPALDAFPADLWAQVAARRLRRVSTNLLAGGEALGYRPLREAVAEYLNTSRGVKCSPDQVLIISGVQEALDRVAHLVLDPGDSVWMEEPGYPGAASTFHAVGAKICPVPIDSQGLDLNAGQKRCPRPRLIY